MRISVSVNDQTKEFDLAQRPVIIGRAETCDFQPTGAGSEFVSGKHAILKLLDGVLTLEDLGSSNGTYVNDLLCTSITRLKPTDRIRLGRLGPSLSLASAPALRNIATSSEKDGEKNIAPVERRSFFGESPLEATEKAPPLRDERRISRDQAQPVDPYRRESEHDRQVDNIFASKNKSTPFSEVPEPVIKDHAAERRDSREPRSKDKPAKQEPSTRALLIKAQRQNQFTWILTLILAMTAVVAVGVFAFVQSRRSEDDRAHTLRDNLLDQRMAAFRLQCSLATAWVRVNRPDQGPVSGSGFLVDRERGLVVTSASLLGNSQSIEVCFPICSDDGSLQNELSLYFDQGKGLTATVVKTDTQKDLALLEVRLEANTSSLSAYSLAQQTPEAGAEIFACGISDGEQEQGWLFKEGKVMAVLEDFMCQIDESLLLDVDMIVASHAMGLGSRGGPVFNEKGEVVAMISHASPDTRLQSQFIAISEIREFYETRVD